MPMSPACTNRSASYDRIESWNRSRRRRKTNGVIGGWSSTTTLSTMMALIALMSSSGRKATTMGALAWSPSAAVVRRALPYSSSSSFRMVASSASEALEAEIKDVGDRIRSMKEGGADKATVAPLVEQLLALKAQREDGDGATVVASAAKETNAASQETKIVDDDDDEDDGAGSSDRESDYITPRSENFSRWYNDLVRVAGLAETSPVRGCMVIKPWGMDLWDAVRTELDGRIRARGCSNAYFPLLIPKSFLSKEAEHVEGFAQECAVVTHHRLTSSPDGTGLIADPEAELEDPLIVRPTSETMIWTMFQKWITSYRDLPLKINQWANVMRWELRTRPFLRTSEFLWQEGHTAHATSEEALDEAQSMMEVYASVCRDLLAMPTVPGLKSPSERFAGAQETFTIEALMPNGWALQSGTSHFLGQTFGKAFDVTFQDQTSKVETVWGTSWGVSTRLLGALVMIHSDDAGLVLPPRVAPRQVVIVPVGVPTAKKDPETRSKLTESVSVLAESLRKRGLRVEVDDREYVRNGAKYFEWERRGVPLRIELGPRDLKAGACMFKYRAGPDADNKIAVPLDEAADVAVEGLDSLQTTLLERAEANLKAGIDSSPDLTYANMAEALGNDEARTYPGNGLFLVPWKDDADNEAKVKEECKATVRCFPLAHNGPGAVDGKKCFYSGEDATHMALFGRAF